MPKNKTLATWLCFIGGPLGLHRFYLFGAADRLAWILPFVSLAGGFGVLRARSFGLDDRLAWLLIPLLGITIAACAVNAIVLGLTARGQWNARFNPTQDAEHATGATNWLTIGAVVASLLVGSTVLLSTIAFGFQHYFEYQIAQARKISQ